MKYPKIVRDNIDFTSDTEVLNVGYYEGTLKDSRPYRLELWLSHEVLNATIFISIKDLEDKEEKEIKKILVDNNIISIIEDKIYIMEVEDVNDNTFLSINVVISDHGKTVNKCLVTTKPYEEW